MDIAVTNKRHRRRWLQFGLRALFVVITLVAFAAAWVGSEMARRRQENAAIATLSSHNSGGSTTTVFDSRFDRIPPAKINPLLPPWQGMPTGPAKKLRNLDLFCRVVIYSCHPAGNTFSFGRDDAGRLRIEREYKAGLTDADMHWVAKLGNLRSLWLGANGIIDQGLAQLSNLARLEVLWLQSTAITDDGLSVLVNFPELRDLDLSGTYVTDASIKALIKCQQLKDLKLQNTNVTPMGIATLQQAMPDCRIVH